MNSLLPHQAPRWTEAHLLQLEQAFPEITTPASADELQRRSGQRSVVQFVRGKLNKPPANG